MVTNRRYGYYPFHCDSLEAKFDRIFTGKQCLLVPAIS